MGANRTRDIEKVMENAVYLHLRYLGYKVAVGTLPEGEIDFVAEKDGARIYIQVAYLLADEKTVSREFGNLREIKDNYPKYVVSMDPLTMNGDYDGITHMPLRTFLLASEL